LIWKIRCGTHQSPGGALEEKGGKARRNRATNLKGIFL
jgi:hypothetical protein